MVMPASGPLNMGGTSSPVSVAQELGLSLTATITMNDAAVRNLAGVGGSGTSWSMSSLYGKSNISYWMAYTTSTQNLHINSISIGPSKVIHTGGSDAFSFSSFNNYFKKASNDNGSVVSSTSLNVGSGNKANVSSVDSSGNQAFAMSAPAGSRFRVYYLNSSNVVQWVYGAALGGTSFPMASAKAVGSTIYYSGNGAPTGAFIAKINSSGNVWMKKSTQNISIVGSMMLSIDASENTYLSLGGNEIQKINSSGNIVWQSRYVDCFKYGPGDLNSSGSNYYVFLKYNVAGNLAVLLKINAATGGSPIWGRLLTAPAGVNINATAFDGFLGAAVDLSENIFCTCTAYDGSGLYRAYLFKYDSSGALQWQRQITVTGKNIYNSVLTTNSDGVVIISLTLLDAKYSELTLKLPSDGSKTGTYTVGSLSVDYSAASFTPASFTASTGAGTVALTDYGLTFSTGGFTPAALAVTTTATNI